MDVLIWGLSAVMAMVFGVSGGAKLATLTRSAQTLRALRLDRWSVRPRVTVGSVALVELVLAGGLVTAGDSLRVAVVFGSLCATSTFLFVAVRATRLGSSDECGCFGDLLPTPVGGALIRRNGVLLAVVATLLVVCLDAANVPPPLAGGLPASLPALVLAILACGCSAAVFSASRQPAPVVRGEIGPGGAVVIAEDGEIVDPVQRALRGRAQLLVFVRRGCSSCEAVTSALRETPLRSVEARIITARGDGGEIEIERSGPPAGATVREHVDPAGLLATQVGAPATRPCAVLLTTGGEVLEPIAEGRDQVLQLMDAIVTADGAADGDRGRLEIA